MRPQHLEVLFGRRGFAVATLFLGHLEQQPLQRVDRLVGALQAILVQPRQLPQPRAARRSQRQCFGRRARALLEHVGQVLPALLVAEHLLDARQGDLVVGLEPQDLVVLLLGLVLLPEALAQARGVVVQRDRGVDRPKLVDRAQVDRDDPVPAIVSAADAFQLRADLGRP